MTKVFGIGVNKTGTTTLAVCLEKLGYRVCPEEKAYCSCAVPTVSSFGLVEDWDAFQDYPWFLPNYYQSLSTLYPRSKFILTYRNAETWWKSFEAWVKKLDTTLERNYVYNSYLSSLDKESALNSYQRHNIRVIEFFSGSNNFAVFDWEAGDDWEDLCKFLEKPVPRVEFPHELKGDYK